MEKPTTASRPLYRSLRVAARHVGQEAGLGPEAALDADRPACPIADRPECNYSTTLTNQWEGGG
jgi:hypothetical protein